MKNKKPILIAVTVIILMLLVFAVWKLTNKGSVQNTQPSQGQQSQTTQKPNEQDTVSSVSGNVFDLIKLGKTLKCTYSMDSQGVTVSGISYISGKNMRGDFESMDPSGNKIQSHMISDGEWVYTWTSATPQGFKMKLSDAESETTPAPNATTQNQDFFKNNVDYKCGPWIEDPSLFRLPSDITFTDFSEFTKNTNTDNKASMCAACDYAQNEVDKSTCKKQLGCE
jgi:outer membrane lipoprotein-sorting protein